MASGRLGVNSLLAAFVDAELLSAGKLLQFLLAQAELARIGEE
jgi:hypothetical protein